ncbi:MAG: DNA repair protein RadC [Formosa sp.]|nr:DNA repair protein RadC [Formosa sp.]
MPQYSLPINQWSQADQPREKLRDKGARFLSDAELLAIVIGSGTQQISAVGLSKILLSGVRNNLNKLGKCTLAQLTNYKGIGEAKAIKIMATMELGRRYKSTSIEDQAEMASSTSVFELMQPILGSLDHEEFWVLYLNNAHRLISKSQLSKGGITAVLVDKRLLFKRALEVGAVALILVHNHPSGKIEPSTFDLRLTNTLKTAAKTLDIKVLDHLIVTEKTYFSFADENLL